jgi:hypothetical protein
MVKVNTALGLSAEFEKLKDELTKRQAEYSELIAHYDELRTTILPNIETEYMMKIGRKEYQVFALQIEILRCKREISLYQAAVNQGETISRLEVEKILIKEFTEYQQMLAAQQQKIAEAQSRFAAAKLDPAEFKKIKKMYLELIKKLHPDLNPNLSATASALFLRVVAAYEHSDWPELYLLYDMADELSATGEYQPDNSVQRIRKELDNLSDKTALLKTRMAEMQEVPPLSYTSLLKDSDAVTKKRAELSETIASLTKYLDELKLMLTTISGE